MAPRCAHYYHAMTQYFIEYHNLYRIVLIRPHLGAESRSSPEKYGLVGCKAKCGIHCWERWKNAIVFSNCCHGFFYSHPSPLKLPCQLSGEKHIGQLWLLVSSKPWVAGFLPVQIIPLHLGLESTCLLLFLELHLLLASVWHHNFIILIYLAFGLSFNPNLGLCIRGPGDTGPCSVKAKIEAQCCNDALYNHQWWNHHCRLEAATTHPNMCSWGHSYNPGPARSRHTCRFLQQGQEQLGQEEVAKMVDTDLKDNPVLGLEGAIT